MWKYPEDLLKWPSIWPADQFLSCRSSARRPRRQGSDSGQLDHGAERRYPVLGRGIRKIFVPIITEKAANG